MTKEDFFIIRNSITMRQVAEHYGLRIYQKGNSFFIRCPFHKGATERTPSLQVFEGFRGFYCMGCGQGGDVSKFVELYEGVTQKEAAIMLSKWFGIQISEDGEIPPESRQKAQKAISERQRELLHQQEIKANLTEIGNQIRVYERVTLTAEPFGEVWCYVQNELPLLIGRWEALFGEMKRID